MMTWCGAVQCGAVLLKAAQFLAQYACVIHARVCRGVWVGIWVHAIFTFMLAVTPMVSYSLMPTFLLLSNEVCMNLCDYNQA